MIASISSFVENNSKNKIAVIGDMLELGALSETAHNALGKEISLSNIDHLVTVGPLASLAADSEKSSIEQRLEIGKFATHIQAVNYLLEKVKKGDCLLIKGSRGARMENIIQGFIKT